MILSSQINPRSAEFQTNYSYLQTQVDDLRAKVAQISLGGGEKARQKHLERGKLLPRERIRVLLDKGS
ncbi:MAG TPA: methylcrotonoyl-CoA carboxylase, partial [Thiolinea sp.]|nr:methylcrotonoyl-CoA carboxylase [Thiolinea sp.]